MPKLNLLSEATVRGRSSGESFARGEEYLRRGAVVRLARRGDQLLAEVEGSAYEPYRVAVTLDDFGVREATCTCPYEWGGDCKHIVAALLASQRSPEAVETRPSLAELLAALDRDALVALVVRLAELRPDVADLVESLVQTPVAGAARTGARPRTTPIDGQAFRRQVAAAVYSLQRMRGSDAYRQVGGVVAEVRAVAEQARPFIDAGDGRSALAILDAVTDEYVNTWTELDDSDGDASEWFHEVGVLWTEALLSADLSVEERRNWAKRLARWGKEIGDYGVDDAFLAAEAAAVQGWDDPRLVRILAGEDVEPAGPRLARVLFEEDIEDEDDEDPDEYDDEDDEDDYGDEDEFDADDGGRLSDAQWYGADLSRIRLRILERQGRIEEYLRLARAEGQATAYATMLVRLGRTAEAVAHGLEELRAPSEALILARTLHDQGATEDALRVAEHGLTLKEALAGTRYAIGWGYDPDGYTEIEHVPHEKVELARWLRDAGRAAGDGERALAAARVAVEASGDLDDYRAAMTLAGDRWPALKGEILARLRSGAPASRVRTVGILLHEGLIDDAIAVADATPYHYALVEQVADAAINARPDWVIRACRAQAEPIMEGGKSQHYDTAARWLAKVRDASVAAGREGEWIAEIESLIERHRRKYKLLPMLQALR